MATTSIQSTLDRVAASKLLRVSVRTIDRYIKSGRLPAYQKNGRIWLKRSDVSSLGRGELVVKQPQRPQNTIRATSTRKAVRVVRPSANELAAATEPAPSYTQEIDSNLYKELYGEAQKRLSEYQSKLEETTRRMSDLEAQLARVPMQHPVMQGMQLPMAPVQPVIKQDGGYKVDMLQKEVSEKDKELEELKEQCARERSNKIAFATITYILLALQPVFWWFLQ